MAKRGGFGAMPGNMNNLMKQAQRMQRQMEENRKALEEKDFTAKAGGGAVAEAEERVRVEEELGVDEIGAGVKSHHHELIGIGLVLFLIDYDAPLLIEHVAYAALCSDIAVALRKCVSDIGSGTVLLSVSATTMIAVPLGP